SSDAHRNWRREEHDDRLSAAARSDRRVDDEARRGRHPGPPNTVSWFTISAARDRAKGISGRIATRMSSNQRAAIAVFTLALGLSTLTHAAAPQRVVALRIDGEIQPVTAEYIDEGIDAANREGAALILITLDTPGGLDTSMRTIIQHIIDSTAPVV